MKSPQVTEAMLRDRIEDGLIAAVQAGKISNRDRGRVREYLRLSNWTLDAQVGMRNDLWSAVLQAVPTLAEPACVTPTPPELRSNNPPEISFGFTKSPEK